MRPALAGLFLAATLSGCVVTVPLRTADTSREPMPTDRTYAAALVERFDSLGRPTAPEHVTNLRVDGYDAYWQSVPYGNSIQVSLSDIHAITILQIERRSEKAAALGALLGGGIPVARGLYDDRVCKTSGDYSCGYFALRNAILFAPPAALFGGIIGATGWPDRRGPVRYVVTPARVD